MRVCVFICDCVCIHVYIYININITVFIFYYILVYFLYLLVFYRELSFSQLDCCWYDPCFHTCNFNFREELLSFK